MGRQTRDFRPRRANPFFSWAGSEPKDWANNEMRRVRSILFLFAMSALLPVPARAILGESLDSLQKRFGKQDQQIRPQKNVAMWSLESDDSERLVYTVTFDAKGHSMAEGLKPVKAIPLPRDAAEAFVASQLAPYHGAASTRAVKPGEKYTFAKQEFTCAANEKVFVDEVNDFMIVWVQGKPGMVMAVRAAMVAGGTTSVSSR